MIVILFGAISSSGLAHVSDVLIGFLNKNFAWFYLLVLPLILVFLICIACSKYGRIKLGGDSEKPEHSTLSWFSMLFCAGTGIGLVFWSIAEPLAHYSNPPYEIGAATQEAADFSIRTCFLHWGILPWTCFAIVGLCIAYFQYRKKKKGTISSAFIPLIGEKRANGVFGKIIDIFAIVVSVAGVATSLGLGCMQICGGLNYMTGVPDNNMTWLIVIIAITAIFLVSSITGVKKGIKILSGINSWMAIALLVLVFFIGPTGKMLNAFVNGIGSHLANFINDSLSISSSGDNSWVMNWRVFYWAWWVAWAPFVGMFVARISKGRTVRQFIIAVIVIPALLTFFWFSVFGTLAIHATGDWTIEQIINIASKPETAVFIVLDTYPLAKVLSVLVMVLLAVFFITSADSATFSLSMLSSDGAENPPVYKKIVWALIVAAMAYILLLSGGLKPLQTISIVAALPFLIIMILMCVSLAKAFKSEPVRVGYSNDYNRYSESSNNSSKGETVEMKKVLILGSDFGSIDLVQEAHRRGLYVIVADNMKTSPAKQLADEQWFVSTADIDELEKRCVESKICGVMAAANDFNVNSCRLLCKRLGLPVYCDNDRAWEISNNKREFKKLCKKVGAPIAEDYYLTDELSDEQLDRIKYPVVVKPVDKAGNRGMSYCHNKRELIEAYKYARSVSDNPEIIVERMLEGAEYYISYVLAEGKAKFLYYTGEYSQVGEKKNMYSIINTTTCKLKQYMNEVNDKVVEVFKQAGCTEGIAWVECIRDKDGKFYLLEMGYRFGSDSFYTVYDKVCGFNATAWIVDCAIGVKHTKDMLPELSGAYRDCAVAYHIFTDRAGEIVSIKGLDVIENIPDLIVDLPKREGSTVPDHVCIGIIKFYAKDCEQMFEIIAKINENFALLNSDGENMYVRFDDFDSIRKRYNEGLKELGI